MFRTEQPPSPDEVINPTTYRHARGALLFTGLALLGGQVHAQARPVNDDRNERRDAQSVKIGEADLYPALRIDYLSDSNVGLKSDDEVSGNAVVISPELEFVADKRLLSFTAGYAGAYSSGSEDALDWADHQLYTGLDLQFDKRKSIALDASFERAHETLGDNLTRGRGGEFDEPVQFNEINLDGRFTYGVEDARGNLSLGVRALSRNYTNFASLVDGRDYDKIEPYAVFSVRVGGNTRALLELRYRNYTFDSGRNDRDEIGVLGGLSFSATGKLTGEARVGVERASYARDEVDDATLLVVEGRLGYRPTSYSELTLDIFREIDNTAVTRASASGDDQSIRTYTRLGWDHDWSTRVSSRAFVTYDSYDRACPDLPTATISGEFELNLLVRRWLELGVTAGAGSRGADDCTGVDVAADELEYDRQVYGAHVRVTL